MMLRSCLCLAVLAIAGPAFAETVAVAGETIERGAIVEARALSTAELTTGEIRTALHANEIVGKQATRRLEAGRIIRASDVRDPLMIEKNSVVTLVVENGNLTIQAAGRSMQGGQRGDIIRVQATGSATMLEGEIVAPGRVRIAAAGNTPQTAAR